MNLSLLNLFGQLPGAISQGFIWGIMAIGVFLTYKILGMADLTVDGSFCTGGAVCVMLILNGYNVLAAMFFAFLAGMATGFVTGVFHVSFGISPILSGILTQIGLWSVNLAIMGKANQAISVNNFRLLVSLRYLQEVIKGEKPIYWSPIIVVGLIIVVIIAALYWFFGTEMGCAIRATGNNLNMARAQGINTDLNKMLGLMLSNGLVALSGGILAQYQGFADINMGRGAIVLGLAAVIIGEVIFGRIFKNFAFLLLGVVLGSVVYYVVIQTVLWLKLDPNHLKLLSAIVVAVFLAVPNLKEKLTNYRQARKGDGADA